MRAALVRNGGSCYTGAALPQVRMRLKPPFGIFSAKVSLRGRTPMRLKEKNVALSVLSRLLLSAHFIISWRGCNTGGVYAPVKFDNQEAIARATGRSERCSNGSRRARFLHTIMRLV
eukprot:1195827-Prorocentrum_minimum.AAC.2